VGAKLSDAVAFAPGGVSDVTARLISQWLSERLGQQFVIDNRPGSGGNIGTEAVVRAPADGEQDKRPMRGERFVLVEGLHRRASNWARKPSSDMSSRPAGINGLETLDSARPGLNCCKNVTPVTGVRGLASAPERNRRFRILSVSRKRGAYRTISASPRAREG
jgi:hypothetical protein